MHWIDWIIVVIPLLFVLWLAFYSRRYIKGVADYLAAGRIAGRYVLSVGDLEAGLSIVTLVSLVESKYQTGFALGFWEVLMLPIGIIMALSGYCIYRFRATRVLSAGQFLEIRYSRTFRVIASSIRVLAEMLANSIGPAVAANFFIYFLGLPLELELFGLCVPSFAPVMMLVLGMAIWVMWSGGRIALVLTDCFQGIISYPVFVIIVCYILYSLSWNAEIAPVMLDRVANQSFLNPYDIGELRDFNLFALIYLLGFRFIGRGNWIGGETSTCGRNPHEQKMAGILGTWKNGFSLVMCIGIAIAIITVLNHENFSGRARNIRTELSVRSAEKLPVAPELKSRLQSDLAAIPEQRHRIGTDAPLSSKNNLDTAYLETARTHLAGEENGAVHFQQFRTLYNQLMMAVTLRNMLPIGIMGIFCLLMVMLMLSTDDTRIFNSSAALIQDVILPLRGKALSPEQHVRLLRLSSVAVALFFFFASLFLSQLDYIMMFTTIMAGLWNGAAAPIVLGGLYTRWGTTTGAFAALVVGSGTSLGGMLLQRNWAEHVYPFLDRMNWVESVGTLLSTVSAPLNPLIVWEMNPEKFPVNSYEIMFLATLGGFLAYTAGSLLIRRERFDLDRMLHRGVYALAEEQSARPAGSAGSFWSRWIGITAEYTRGDRVIAWSAFLYTIVYQLLFSFIAVAIWNIFDPWPSSWWSAYFLITVLIVPSVIGVVSTVWFMWGGIRDSLQLFRDLEQRRSDPLDNGMVSGHVSCCEIHATGDRRTSDPSPAAPPGASQE